MIENIDNWKIYVDGWPILIKTEAGLVKQVIAGERKGFELLRKWNIYSVIRYLFEQYKTIEMYREKNKVWIKLKTEKVKEIAFEPMLDRG